MANIKIEMDHEDSVFDLNVARDRFESALHELRNKDDTTSTSENESDTEIKSKPVEMQLPIRPARKKRRKDIDIKESGFHQTYVMRMFDRSVDLAQFEESSPLYPICRAWMLNYPTNEQTVKTEPSSPLGNDVDDLLDHDSNDRPLPDLLIKDLPSAEPYNEVSRIPSPVPQPNEKLATINGMENVTLLLDDHLSRWRQIRSKWKDVGLAADARYSKTHFILKTMFER